MQTGGNMLKYGNVEVIFMGAKHLMTAKTEVHGGYVEVHVSHSQCTEAFMREQIDANVAVIFVVDNGTRTKIMSKEPVIGFEVVTEKMAIKQAADQLWFASRPKPEPVQAIRRDIRNREQAYREKYAARS
jgi:hypothetical protein